MTTLCLHLTLKMTTTQVVETSVTNNSLSKDYPHSDNHAKQITDTPGFKPYIMNQTILRFSTPRESQLYLQTGPRHLQIKGTVAQSPKFNFAAQWKKISHWFTFSMVAMYKECFLRRFLGGILPLLPAYSSTKNSKSTANSVRAFTLKRMPRNGKDFNRKIQQNLSTISTSNQKVQKEHKRDVRTMSHFCEFQWALVLCL